MAEVALNIEGGALPELAAEIRPGRRVEWLIGASGFATACMAAAAAIYKPPSGIFNDHKRAYYVSVVSAGVAGLGAVCAAVIWLSGGHEADGHRHQRLARRWVLCASFVPLAFIAGLGGVRMLVKGMQGTTASLAAVAVSAGAAGAALALAVILVGDLLDHLGVAASHM